MISKTKPLHIEWHKSTILSGAFLLLFFVLVNFLWLPSHLPQNI